MKEILLRRERAASTGPKQKNSNLLQFKIITKSKAGGLLQFKSQCWGQLIFQIAKQVFVHFSLVSEIQTDYLLILLPW